MSRHNRKFRKKNRSRHHVVNVCRGGMSTPENIISLSIKRHRLWHTLFHNMTFLEVAELLLRADHMLKRRSYEQTHITRRRQISIN